MSLSGSVESFPLKAVLSLLEATAARGILHLTCGGASSQLHVDGGALVAWEPDRTSEGPDVVAALMEAPDATFVWDHGSPELAHPPVLLADVVRQAEDRLGQWGEMRAIVATPEHRITLRSRPGDATVSVSAADWQVVCAVGDGRPMREVLSRLSLPALSSYRAVGELAAAGLIAVEAPAPSDTSPAGPAGVATAATGAFESRPASDGTVYDHCDAAPVTGASVLVDADAAVELAAEITAAGAPETAPVAAADGAVDGWQPTWSRPVADEALTDRGPWPTEDLRSLVEQAQRDSEAAPTAGEAMPAYPGESAPAVPATAWDAGGAGLHGAHTPAPSGPAPLGAPAGRLLERGSLLRFFSATRA